MSIRELPAYAKRAILRNAAAAEDELSGTFYRSDLIADCSGHPDSAYWYQRLVDTIRNRATLLPDSTDIPCGYESRAEADISVATKDQNIDWFLSCLVPDDGIPAAKVKYDPNTGTWLADIRLVAS